jgi:hypothetical protein
VQAKFTAPSTPMKLNANLVERKRTNPERTLAPQMKSTKAQGATLVHLTGSKISTVPITQTLWIMVESEATSPAAPPVYQIQMWRLTVLRTVISAPSRQISRSET